MVGHWDRIVDNLVAYFQSIIIVSSVHFVIVHNLHTKRLTLGYDTHFILKLLNIVARECLEILALTVDTVRNNI